MTVKSIIESGSGNGKKVAVTDSGELVVASIQYDETEFKELAEPDTAYNFYIPMPVQQFIVTGVIAYGDKQVSSNTNATVIIYESCTSDSLTVEKVLLQFEIGQNQNLVTTPLRVRVNPGVWVNAKTDDDDIHLTITGYYIPQIR